VRLCDNKAKYNITFKNIAVLLNAENGKDYDESAYRKRFADFNRGRQYERDSHTEYVAERILAISDLHIPFEVPISTFSTYSRSVDTLVLNGDVMDCQSISFFPKKYRINFIEEIIQARQYIISLVEMIKPRKVVVTKGNHEHRMLRYLTERLNDDLLNLMPDSPMDLIINDGFKDKDRLKRTETYYPPLREVFSEQSISIYYNGDWYCRIGNVIFAHPLAYSSSMMKTAEKAVTFFSRSGDRSFTALVMGHTHKVGFYKLGDVSVYEQGCLCRLDILDYADGKLQDPQQNGYMYICLDKFGNIIEDKTKLITTI
jgi:predicted phosphodiesterase